MKLSIRHTKSNGRIFIGSVAVATPPCVIPQSEAMSFLSAHFSDRLSPRKVAVMKKVLSHPSVQRRAYAFDRPETLLEEDPDARIARFTHWAVELSAQAAHKALQGAGLGVDDISAIVVNTCTGYVCPGISTYLIEKMGFSTDTMVFDLVGSGCGGAIPNLQVAGSLLDSTGGAVLSVSVEICSATFQMEDDLSLIVSNALFGDGASAAVLWPRPEGLELVATASRYIPEHRDAIRYVHKNGQLHNQLSMSLHRLVKGAVKEVVEGVLASKSLSCGDIDRWAFHTGGEKIINAIRDELGLAEEYLHPTRKILAAYGNMSSPTVIFVLKEILNTGMGEGQWCVLASFGAGLSAHSALLKKRERQAR